MFNNKTRISAYLRITRKGRRGGGAKTGNYKNVHERSLVYNKKNPGRGKIFPGPGKQKLGNEKSLVGTQRATDIIYIII